MCSLLYSAHEIACLPFRPMATTTRGEFKRLILKIERDLFAQAHLRALMTALDTALAEDQKALRAIEAQIKQTRETATASGRNTDREVAAHRSPARGRPSRRSRTSR